MSKEAKLGLFVIVVFAVFLFFTVNMGSGLFAGQKRTYPIYFSSIGTLEKGAPVKQAGLDVGEVTGIALKEILEPTPTFYVVANVSVNEHAHIAFDSKASIQTMGMMGEKYVEISFGRLEKAPEGTRIDGQGSQPLDKVMDVAVKAIEEINKLMISVNVIFNNERFQQDMTQLIHNLEQFSTEINDLLGGQEERLKTILSNMQVASANLNSLIATSELFVTDARGMVNENRAHLKKTLENTSDLTQTLRDELPGNFKKITDQLTSLGEQLNKSAQNADRVIAKMDTMFDENRPDIKEAITNIKDFTASAKNASTRVEKIIQQIDEGDGLVHDLIYDPDMSKSTKDLVVQANETLSGVSSIGERFTWEIDSRYYPDRPRFDRDDSHARVDFGVKYDMTDNTSVYLGANSLGTANDLEAQLGYKVGPITFHGGMIESEFGLGVDWSVLDRWTVGLEGVGLTDSGNERLDAYTEFLVWNHVYLVGGVQDITDDAFPNVGMKMRF